MVNYQLYPCFSVLIIIGTRGDRSWSEAKTDKEGCYSWRRFNGFRDSNSFTSKWISSYPERSQSKVLGGWIRQSQRYESNKVNTLIYKFLTNIFYVHTGNLSSSVRKGKLSQEKMEKILSSLKGVLDYESFKDVDMVIEVLILTI